MEDEIRIYYSGQKKTHDWNDGWLCLARLRRDGWAGYLPRDDAGPAVLVTNPILCDGRTMRVTADIRNGGSVKVTLLDDSGKSISEGLTLTTDVTDAAAADVSALQGERVRVRFDFRRAQVYSLRFVK